MFLGRVYCSSLEVFCTENITKKNGEVLNKPQMNQLLKNPGGTFLQIQTDRKIRISSLESICELFFSWFFHFVACRGRTTFKNLYLSVWNLCL